MDLANKLLLLLSMPIFLLLFMMTVFETRRYYPTEHRFLQGLIVLIGAAFVWACLIFLPP